MTDTGSEPKYHAVRLPTPLASLLNTIGEAINTECDCGTCNIRMRTAASGIIHVWVLTTPPDHITQVITELMMIVGQARADTIRRENESVSK